MNTRFVAAAVAVLALLLGSVSTAAAQDEPTSTPSLEPTVVEPSPTASSPAPTPSTEPSTPSPSTTTAAPPRSSTPPAPTASRTPTTSGTPRPTKTGADAAAPPGPTTPSPTPSTSAPSRTYNTLVPWIPANDHPEILALAVAMILAGGGGMIYLLERGPRRRNRRT